MILPDSSAWIEFIRGTGSATHLRLRSLVSSGRLATTGPVLTETTAGARNAVDLRRIRRMLGTFTLLPAGDPEDYLLATVVYRACRAGGETVRGLLDCLIAAVAIREGALVLHHDRDFAAIARHTPLQLA